jgi:stearoyl-CoA desaturase (delta-9 desaturase)
MNFIDYVLQEPSYKWKKDSGSLVIPGRKQLLKEALSRINVFKSRKNWTSIAGLVMILCMVPFLYRC